MFLELKNCSVGYTFPLISEATFSLDLGEICLLIGNNGAGKSTLFKTVLSTQKLISGEILVKGRNIHQKTNKEIAELVSVVFSKSEIPASFTVFDLISLGRYIHYPFYFDLNESDKEKIESIIESIGLSSLRNTLLAELSDGNLQKAFIGRALAQDTPAIFLDEPTTHLDEENKIMILQFLRGLAKKENKLIFFSSHDWRLAKDFADSIAYIKKKKIHFGLAEDLLLSHSELNPQQIELTSNGFVAPQIIAPEYHKNLLASALLKNFTSNLSYLKIEFQSPFWVVKTDNTEQKVTSIAEIIHLIKNNR